MQPRQITKIMNNQPVGAQDASNNNTKRIMIIAECITFSWIYLPCRQHRLAYLRDINKSKRVEHSSNNI